MLFAKLALVFPFQISFHTLGYLFHDRNDSLGLEKLLERQSFGTMRTLGAKSVDCSEEAVVAKGFAAPGAESGL